MFYITRPNSENYEQFTLLIPPRFRGFLDHEAPETDMLVLGANSLQRNLIGLLIGCQNARKPSSYTICYLWVLQSYRAIGVEEALLGESEKMIRAHGYAQIEVEPKFFSQTRQLYTTQDAQPLLQLFQDLGWDQIVACSTSFYIHDQRIMQERWFRLQIPNGYELFYWKDLNAQEKTMLQERQAEFGQELDPLAVAPFDPYTSLGVRNTATGDMAGWMVNSEVRAQAVVAFRRLFIFPPARSKGLFTALLSHSIRSAFQHYDKARFDVAGNNLKMKTTVLRMMGHLCDTVVENYYCRKELRCFISPP